MIRKLEEMQRAAGDIIQSMGRISAGLRPATLDVLGLQAAIKWQSDDFTKRTGIVCEMHARLDNLRLDGDLSTAVFRIFQEALTNVTRHAKASRVTVDLGLDGLMIEAHPNPDQAWSDASQQVTPERLGEILELLAVRRAATADPKFNASLEALRESIDRIDHEILDVLSQRMRIIERIGEAKRASNVVTLQVTRWKALLDDRLQRAVELGLNADTSRPCMT